MRKRSDLHNISKIEIVLLCICSIMLINSCRAEKTTESIIINQTNQDFTIYFSNGDRGYFIKSNSEKTVHMGNETDNKLSFPFVTDTVRLKLKGSNEIVYFAKSNMNDEYNIFDIYNWTYSNNSNYYTKATYSFTNKILADMDELN